MKANTMILPDDVVEQGDRELAADVMQYMSGKDTLWWAAIKSGDRDDHGLVQMIAQWRRLTIDAALEVARYGEMRAGLERAAENFERLQAPHVVGNDVHNFAYQAAKQVRALLSTIGDPTDIGASQS